jgi:hypothetical protein
LRVYIILMAKLIKGLQNACVPYDMQGDKTSVYL